MTYKTYIKKEIMEHIRKYRLLILFVVIMMTAFSAPIVLYFLPKILASQANSAMDFSMLFDSGQVPAIQNFVSDMYEIPGILIIIFASTIFVHEFSKATIVIPLSNGLNFKSMLLSKLTVYSLMISLLLGLGFAVNHFYSGIVFNEFTARIDYTIYAFIAFTLYIIYHVTMVSLLTVYFKHLFPVITISLGSYFILPSLFQLLQIKISPYMLIKAFNIGPLSDHVLYSIYGTILVIGIFIILSIRKKIEI